ncbi:DMT family transporter [Melioribacteraceae bacterium 4301-Me]|uniref:DMT family transporter n=1 Tax=Pyranulibacter aquaticus TaxID=3163344 RepID=UPI00359B0264
MPYLGEIAALLTALFWSATAIVFTEASILVGSLFVNISRLILAAIFLLFTILALQLGWVVTSNQIVNLALSGFAGLVIGDTFLFKSFQFIGARLSMLIMALVPGMSAILAYFFLNESISFIGVLGIFLTILGIAIVVLKREEKVSSRYTVNVAGVFYAFIGAVGQAVGLIFAKQAFNEGEINGFLAALIRIVSAIVFIYPLTVMAKKIANPFSVFKNKKRAFAYTLIGSAVGPYLGITLSLVSIKYAKVGIASTLMATVPIIMLPMVKYYYKEKLSWVSILGAFIAVGGVTILFLR